MVEPATMPGPSQRVRAVPPSGIRAVVERARGPVLNLATGDPAFDSPNVARDGAIAAIRAGDTHYTATRGTGPLRAAIAADLERRCGVTVDPELEVLVASGAMNALAATILALVDPGDEVLLPDPGFTNYRSHVLLAGGRPVAYPLLPEAGFVPDVEDVAARLTARTRVLVLNSPSNPTGGVIDRDTLTAMLQLVADANVVVVSDEAYRDVLFDGAEHVHAAELVRTTGATVVSIFSHSKSYAMTGWRLGAAVAPAPLIDALSTVQDHLVGCPSSVSQAAALAVLIDPPAETGRMLAVLADRRRRAIAALSDLPGVELVAPSGALYLFPDVGDGDAVATRLVEDHGVLVVPGSAFGANAARHLRVTFAADDDVLDEGLARIRAALRAPTMV